MRRRPDPAVVELATARLAVVLGGSAAVPPLGGWVPPPLDEAPTLAPAPAPERVRPVSDRTPGPLAGPRPDVVPLAERVPASGPVPTPLPVPEPAPAPAPESQPASEPEPERQPVPWRVSVAVPDAGPGPTGGVPLPRSGWRGLLPESVLGGRVDPGRSGVLALVAVAVVAALVAGGVLLRGRPQEVSAPTVLASGGPLPGASAAADGQVVVAVAGKVRTPGIVRLPAGSRVDDAVRAAGGLAPGASPGLLNLARRLVDGEQVLVGVEAAPGGSGAPAPGGLLDLNTATAEQLDDLPGVGPVLAERIVDWRTEHGRFASVDQLREVSGIGESKYASMKSKVRV